MAIPSSFIAWRIPEEPGELQAIGSERVRHDWSDLACIHARTHTDNLKKKSFLKVFTDVFMGFPDGSVVKNLPIKQEMWFRPWVRKIPWRRKWQPHPVFSLPGKSHRQRSLEGYSLWGCKETGMTQQLNNMLNPRWVNKMIAPLWKKYYGYITKHTFQLIPIYLRTTEERRKQ